MNAADELRESVDRAVERLRSQVEINRSLLEAIATSEADNDRLRAGIDRIIGMCLGNAGIGEIHAAARALVTTPDSGP